MQSNKYVLCQWLRAHGQFEMLSCGPDREALQQEADRRNQERFDRDLLAYKADSRGGRPVEVFPHFFVEEVPEFPLVKEPST